MSLPNITLLLYILTLSNLLLSIILYIRSKIKNKWSFNSSPPDTYDTYALLYEINKIMASTIQLEELVDKLLSYLFEQLKIKEGALLLLSDKKITWAKTFGYINTPIFDESIFSILINNDNDVIIVDELEESYMKTYLKNNYIKVIVPLIEKNEAAGILLLGDKTLKEPFFPQDIKILEIVAPEMTIAIRNAESYEQIRRFNISLQEQIESSTTEMKKINEEVYKKSVDLKHVSEGLAEANEKLKQLDNLKDEFVSLASHELRTPMTAIKSYLWLFLQTKNTGLNNKQQMYIERAYQATDRLITLVNDMLNVSRIESGRMNVILRPLNIVQLIREVIDELTPTALKQQISLTSHPESDSLPNVTADQNKIREVLINLIGNSLKFTNPSGTVTVKVFRTDDKLVIQVIDTGKGIKPEDLPKLFHKFQTVGANYLTKISSQGTGLGLYLSKAIIELHHGKIWVESKGEGKGSIFSFSLPIDQKLPEAEKID